MLANQGLLNFAGAVGIDGLLAARFARSGVTGFLAGDPGAVCRSLGASRRFLVSSRLGVAGRLALGGRAGGPGTGYQQEHAKR